MVRKLPYLSGLAVIAVVLNHALGWGFTAMFWWTHRYKPVTSPNFDQAQSISYFVLRTFEQLVIFAVPAFLFISGFFIVLVLNRKTGESGWPIIIRRIRTLLIPYLIWSGIILVTEAIQGRSFELLDVIRIIAFGGAAPGFYFIPLLFQLYLLSPLVLKWGRASWVSLLLVSGFVMVLISFVRYGLMLGTDLQAAKTLTILTAGWFFPGSLFWFAFGVVAGLHQKLIRDIAVRGHLFWKIGVFVLVLLGIWEWEFLYLNSGREWLPPALTFVDMLTSFAMLMVFGGISDRYFVFQKHIARLGGKAYGIYLVHILALIFVARGIYHVAPALLAFAVIFVAILTVSGVTLPVLLMDVVKRSPAKRGYEILFG